MWRHATDTDDDHIVAMFVALNIEDPGVSPILPDQCRFTLQVLRTEPIRGVAVVLELDGRAEGYAMLISSWSNELGGEVCTIDELYVNPAHRGAGHATELLATVEQLFSRPHVAHALEVSPNNSSARELYERQGFTLTNAVMIRRVQAT